MPSDCDETLTHKKPHLPVKICAACERPFTWRKKWARDWEQVKYCSQRCRSGLMRAPCVGGLNGDAQP
ncbi:DUF2256 domain-containing protein [Novosphingobium sp. PS1R-30]|uniref:DUF2256 domain-containing protein n=1 Tax=Novosphingobium anseongense TaxID=3133436 RepID=A0ABU8RV56_9SPHN